MSEAVIDQAQGLRRMLGTRGITVLPLAATQRDRTFGVMVANIAAALQKKNQRVIILDAGAANLGRVLGIHFPYDLEQLLSGEREFIEVVVRATEGVQAIKAKSGLAGFIKASGDRAQLFGGFRNLDEPYDIAIIAGTIGEIAPITAAEDEIAFITSTDADAITATYAEIKRSCTEFDHKSCRIIFHSVEEAGVARQAFGKLRSAAQRFLAIDIGFGGSISRDSAFTAADRQQKTVFGVAPMGNAVQDLLHLADSIQDWRLAFFGSMEQ